jgi:hypothetical protein
MTLTIVPVTFRQACQFIDAHHRHHRPPQGMRLALGVADESTMVGVATVGRPVARHLDDGRTAEITRTCCADGARNANSMLYAACWRAARAIGYQRLVTYTQTGETGGSLRAAGFHPTAHLDPHHGRDRPSRPRPDGGGGVARTRWEIHISNCPAAPTSAADPAAVREPRPNRRHYRPGRCAAVRLLRRQDPPRGPHRRHLPQPRPLLRTVRRVAGRAIGQTPGGEGNGQRPGPGTGLSGRSAVTVA